MEPVRDEGPTITITLNQYQLGNLLALFKEGRDTGRDTGDWYGEILLKIQDELIKHPEITELHANFGESWNRKQLELLWDARGIHHRIAHLNRNEEGAKTT